MSKSVFKTLLGKCQYEYYPEEVQKELRDLWKDIQENGKASQQLVYDMIGGWVFVVRLFHENEKQCWYERVWDEKNYSGKIIGAQWDKNKATPDPGPPWEFEAGVQYRPVYLDNAKYK